MSNEALGSCRKWRDHEDACGIMFRPPVKTLESRRSVGLTTESCGKPYVRGVNPMIQDIADVMDVTPQQVMNALLALMPKEDDDAEV